MSGDPSRETLVFEIRVTPKPTRFRQPDEICPERVSAISADFLRDLGGEKELSRRGR